MDGESLWQLTYVSERIAGLADDEVIDDIVLPSILRNRQQEVSGCLWFDDANFVQVIEGKRETVGDLFERIASDYRHAHVTVLSEKPVLARSFERFHMRSIEGGPIDAVTLLLSFKPAGAAVRDPAAIDGVVSRVVEALATYPD